jgi:hypothetical protein
MAVQTSNIVAGMYRSGETPLRMTFAVTAQTAIGGLLLWELAEPNDLADVPSALDML